MRKLSDITGEEAFDVTAELIEQISKIVSSDKVQEMREQKDTKVRDLVSYVLKKKRSNIVKMLSVLDGCSPKEYIEKTTVASLLADGTSLLTDPLVQEIFMSQSQNAENVSSGSATDGAKEEA